MVRSFGVLRAAPLAAAVLLSALDADAQVVRTSESLPSSFSVTLRAEEPEGLRIELYDPRTRPPHSLPAAVCFDRCELRAVAGRYLLRVSGPPGSGVRTSKANLELDAASMVTIDPPSIAGRYVGLGLGIAGTLAVMVGAALLIGGSPYMDEPNEPGESDGRRPVAGGITLASGIVAAPIGWVMFGMNGGPAVDVRPTAPRSGAR